jgi:hypothetical protein
MGWPKRNAIGGSIAQVGCGENELIAIGVEPSHSQAVPLHDADNLRDAFNSVECGRRALDVCST